MCIILYNKTIPIYHFDKKYYSGVAKERRVLIFVGYTSLKISPFENEAIHSVDGNVELYISIIQFNF